MNDKPKIASTEPGDSNDAKKHKFFYGIPIRGGDLLRKRLRIDDKSYHFIWGPNTSAPRDYFLYGVLNETDKAGISMMQHADFVRESKANYDAEKHKQNQRLSDNILQSRIDELTIWQRKMTEILIDLIGFRAANSGDYYRHYIIVHELADKRKAQKDFRTFYKCENKNLGDQIIELEQKAAQLAAKLDPTKCWYIKLNNQNQITTGLMGFEGRFKTVFPIMKDVQKAVLRTYGTSFGMQSEMLHPSTISRGRNKPLDLDDVDSHISRIGILSLHVIAAAKDLMRIHNVKGFLKEIADLAKNNEYPITLFKKQTSPKIEVGDYVTAYNDLAQVTKVIKSTYGYKSFRVKYLETPPMPEIPEDEFTAQYVHLLYSYKDLEKGMRRTINLIKPARKRISSKRLEESITGGVIDAWNNGLKDHMFGDPETGRKKAAIMNKEIEEFIKKYGLEELK
jgi:hypothetical protein